MESDRTYHVRPATQKDALKIRLLVVNGAINPTGLKWQRFVVAETEQGEVIGCGQIKKHRDGSAELASIVVTPAWQAKGVARALIETLLKTHSGDLYLMCKSSLGVLYRKFDFYPADEHEMPPYFRRVQRLSKPLLCFMPADETLLIMKYQPASLIQI